MKNHLLTTVAALALALPACSPADEVTAPSMLQPSASVDATSQGAVILRDQTFALFFNIDTDRDLISLHIPPTSPWICGGANLPNIVERTRIVTPSDVEQFLAQVKDDNSAVGIYRGSTLADAGVIMEAGMTRLDPAKLCPFLNSPAKVAAGIVRHVQHLSNASFSAHWQGTLTAPDGRAYRYSEAYQLGASLHEPNDPAEWVVHVSKILLTELN